MGGGRNEFLRHRVKLEFLEICANNGDPRRFKQKGRRHWVPEDGSHGCSLTELGGSGTDGLETPFGWSRNESHPQADTYYARILGATGLYCMWFFCSTAAWESSRFFPSPSFLFFRFACLLHVCGWDGNFSHGVHFSRSSLLKTKEKNIIRSASRNRPRLHLVFVFSPLLFTFSLYTTIISKEKKRTGERNCSVRFNSTSRLFTTLVALGSVKFGWVGVNSTWNETQVTILCLFFQMVPYPSQ